jgi:hypothetical protein
MAGLDNGDVMVDDAFSATHASLSGFLSHRFVGKDPDPDLAATLDVVDDGPAGCLELPAGHPATFRGLQTIIAEGQDIPSGRHALHPPPVHLSVFETLGH